MRIGETVSGLVLHAGVTSRRIAAPLQILLVVASVLVSTSPAHAQPATPSDTSRAPDSAERKAARILADEGLALFQRGDYAGALGKFEQAEKLVPAVTIAIESARSLDKLGRLLEARERYEAIVAEELPKIAPFVAHKAQDDANAELGMLKQRIPTLELAIQGPRGDGIELFVDDAPQPLTSFEGVDRAIDPGSHTIQIKRRDSSVAKAVKISEGNHAKVRILLPPVGGPVDTQKRARLMREMAWISYGIGGGFLLIATGTGIAAVNAHGDLKAKCPTGNCPPAYWGKVDRYNALRATTTTTLVLGVAGAAAGTTLFFLGPRLPPSSKPGAPASGSLRGSLGLGYAELELTL